MHSISTKLGSALLVSILLFFLVSITFSYQELNRTYNSIVSIAAHTQLAQISGSGSGLVAHYTFDETSGTTAGDSAGSNTGTLVNGPVWGSGRIGGGLTFDGVDDSVSVSPGPLNFNTYTMSFWIKPNAGFSGTLYRLSNSIANTEAKSKYEVRVSSSRIIFITGDGTTADSDYITTSISSDSWSHVVCTLNEVNEKSCYLNGALVSSITNDVTISLVTPTVANIATNRAGAGQNYFEGTLDDVRIYNRALSASEVLDLYNAAGEESPADPNPTPTPGDTTPPTITVLPTASSITTTGATISWTTDESATSQVQYGPTSSYTSNTTETTSRTTTHSVNLSSLTPNSTYHYRVISKDAVGNTVNSNDGTFSTSAVVAPPVTPPTSGNRVDRLNSSGTLLQTFTTIQACTSVATAGDTCVVSPGTYTENITFGSAGASSGRIKLQAKYPWIRGSNSNPTIIEGLVTLKAYTGIYGLQIVNSGVIIDGSNTEVVGNFVHGTGDKSAGTGVSFTRPTPYHSHVLVQDNYFYQISYGMLISCSDDCLFENNEIERLYTPVACRPEGACAGDSDYVRIFGNGITLRSNKIHGSLLTEIDNDAHVDGIQSFTNGGLGGQGRDTLTNIVIENNWVQDAHQTIWWTTATSHYNGVLMESKNITIRNNIFLNSWGTSANMSVGGLGVDDLYIYNNTFGQTVKIISKNRAVIKNNIFLNSVRNTPESLFVWPRFNYEMSNNIISTDSSSQNATMPTYYPILFSDLGHILVSDSNSLFVNRAAGDYRLKQGSVAINAGANLSSLFTEDKEGNPRGSTWDIGAYEYQGAQTPPSTYTVTATKAGTGSGTLTGTGLSCTGNTCAASVANSSSIILTATPSTGSTFTGWSSGCTGTGTCTLSSAGSVTATFTLVPDTTQPTVSLTSPSGTISSTVTLSATASDNVAVTSVQFLLDNSVISTLTTAPYTGTWNTLGISDGTHNLTAIARDAAGNTKTSNPVTVTINNNTAPVLSSIGSQSVQTGTQLSFTVLASDAQNNTLTYSASSLPQGATFSNRVFTWTPSTTGTYRPTFTVTDGSLTDTETITITVTAPLPVSEDTDGDGISNAIDKCPLTPLSLRSEVNIYGCPKPRTTKFTVVPDPSTTDISTNLSSLELSNAYGKVVYATPVVLYRDQTTYKGQLDIDTHMNIQSNTISLTSASLPELNKTATIYLYNITHRTPRIMKDGILCTTCTFVSYSNNIYTFRVTGFSTYTVEETPSTTGGGTTSSGGSTGTFTPTVTQVAATSTITTTSSLSPYSGLSLLLRNLYRGITGEDVRTLQRFLVIEGLLTIDTPTTYFGILTETAVKAFQAKNSIVSSGTPYTTGYGSVGPKTRGVINAKIGSSVGVLAQPASAQGSGGARVEITQTLMYDMTDPQVITLQTYLISKGYLSSQATGYYGTLTEAAVKKLQCEKLSICSGTAETNGYGVVGPRTRASLR